MTNAANTNKPKMTAAMHDQAQYRLSFRMPPTIKNKMLEPINPNIAEVAGCIAFAYRVSAARQRVNTVRVFQIEPNLHPAQTRIGNRQTVTEA